MLHEIEAYQITCDGHECLHIFARSKTNPIAVEQAAIDHGWLKIEDKHYCNVCKYRMEMRRCAMPLEWKFVEMENRFEAETACEFVDDLQRTFIITLSGQDFLPFLLELPYGKRSFHATLQSAKHYAESIEDQALQAAAEWIKKNLKKARELAGVESCEY